MSALPLSGLLFMDCTRPTRPSVSRTLMPRGWFPLVSTSWIVPDTVRPVGWSTLRTMLTPAPGMTCRVVGTGGMFGVRCDDRK